MPVNKVSALIDINELKKLQEKPPLFAPGEPEFWTDPYISKQMLTYHLDQNSDAASRKEGTIQRTVDWIVSSLGLKEGSSLMDLGCGPGLYTSRFAKYGLKVTGVDFSQNSINYAINSAHQQGLEITYRCQDYLQLTDEAQYDAALLIYGDFCPLSPEKRTTLLANVQRMLKPGGFFVLDVTTPFLREHAGLKNGWYAADSGFWKPTAHLVLEQGYAYEGDVYLDQYIVVEENAKVTVYRNWFQDYTADRIRAELQANGFLVQSMWSDLTGTDYQQESEWIGVVTRRV